MSTASRLFRLAALALLVAALGTGGALAVRSAAAPAGPSAPADAPTIRTAAAIAIPARSIAGASTDREVTIVGSGFYGTSFGPFVRFAGRDAVAVIMDADDPSHVLVAYPPAGLRGRVEVVVENPDRQSVRTFLEL